MRAGVAAEFETADALLHAVKGMREAGYDDLDAFTPYPIEGLDEALALRRSPLNWIVFPLGMSAAAAAFGLMWFCNAYSYPINVGGRPGFAIPAFVPITFETAVLASSLIAFVLLWALCRLPALTHPLFGVEGFDRASLDRFWLVVGTRDVKLLLEYTPKDLEKLGALRVTSFGDVSNGHISP
ncbi:MAG: DUF3341 domain-containing protein [Polyangia bacterium]